MRLDYRISDLVLQGKYPDVSKSFNGLELDEKKVKALKGSPKIISLCYWNKCNLLCPYCVSSMNLKEVQKVTNIVEEIGIDKFIENLQKLVDIFKADGSDVRIVFSSGEPGMSEEFEQLFDFAMANNCFVGIQTNLHYAQKYDRVFSKYPADLISAKVRFNVSYHLGTYLTRKFSDYLREKFLKEYLPVLVKHNVAVSIITPLTPEVLTDEKFESELNYIKSIFPINGVSIQLVELVHIYKGKRYPDSFTAEEKNKIIELCDRFNSIRQRPTDGQNIGYNEFYYLKGMRCFLPTQVVQIVPNGDFVSCEYEAHGITGNIKTPEKFEEALSNKDYIYCPFNVCHCSSAGNTFCLSPANITIDKYIGELDKQMRYIDPRSEAYLHCVYTNKAGEISLSLSNLARKMYLSNESLAINTAFFNENFKKENWYDTIFPEIEIVRDMCDKLPDKHKSLFSAKPDEDIDFYSLIQQMKQSLKDYFVKSWDSKAKKVCLHSAGYDSRIISGILTELRQEMGDQWIGELHFRCHQPEEKEFIEIMQLQGWRDDQYSVWDKPPQDHYNIGRTTQTLNGFNPIVHQMDFISDIVPDDEKKNTVIISGSNGGEFFNYPVCGVDPVKNIEYCKNPNVNRWLNYFAEEGEWLSMFAYEYKGLLAPYLSYDYLGLASLMPDKYLKSVTPSLDTVRQAILETMSINTIHVNYGFHQYTWGISEETKQKMSEWYVNSLFHKTYGITINFDNIVNDISAHDGKLWAFSLMYEKIFQACG